MDYGGAVTVLLEHKKLLGCKGHHRHQASFMELFDGDTRQGARSSIS